MPPMTKKRDDDLDLIGPSQVSHILDISTVTVRRWTKDGILPSIPVHGVGAAYRRADIERLAAERRKGPKKAE
jgi:predicted site-specific integrase-resolvase